MTTPQPDFLRPARGPDALAWWACAAACLALVVAAIEAGQAWQARADAQAAAERRLAAQVRSAPVARMATPSPADLQARQATLQAWKRLQRPWPQAFRAVEAIDVPGLAWLVLEIGETGTLRLQGEATDAQAAMAAAGALRRQAAWSQVVLGRMDRTEGGGLRFELTGTMPEAAP